MDSDLFSGFDFGILNSPTYKEDAVREDLIAPLLRSLGYRPSGENRMERSQQLLHPYVMIGSQRRKIYITPDYTLYNNDHATLVLDAKRPSESIIGTQHVEQVFSYAIHPDIRTKSYALCNGHIFVLYDIDQREPVFQFKLQDARCNWLEILKHLSPVALSDHHHRNFQLDLGIFLKNAGFSETQDLTFFGTKISSLGCTQGGILSATASLEMPDGFALQGSFDMPMEALPIVISKLPDQAKSMITNALMNPCAIIYVGGIIEISWTTRIGKEEQSLHKHDPLIPLIVRKIQAIEIGSELELPKDGVPSHILNVPNILRYI